MNKISIITATLNSEKKISRLIKSLNKQSNKCFNWIIKDGGSTDSTLNKLSMVDSDIDIKIIKGADKGIYDALNQAIKKCKTNYYLVIGSDDELNFDSIENFYQIINRKDYVDIVAASWIVNNKIIKPKKNLGWLYGMLGISSCHSVSTLVRTSLHIKFGYYSLDFPICSDQLFIKKAIYGNSKIYRSSFISGIFYQGGNSSKNTLSFLVEQYKIQLLTEDYHFLQLTLFILRLLKNYKKIV